MNFVQKLIDDTKAGSWDFCWNFNIGSQSYALIKTKYYLSGLNFTTANKNKNIIFPNGSSLESELLGELETAVRESIMNTAIKMVDMYLSEKDLAEGHLSSVQFLDKKKLTQASDEKLVEKGLKG